MTARLPINLMLVEDERIVAFDLQRQLHGFGYRVGAVVASGEQAVKKVADEKPDLVLMDIHLEGSMDGIQAAAEIRNRHRIPVVFLTAYAEDDTLRRALESRPFGYLVKPCEGRELHATIQMALARREDEVAVEVSEERLKLAIDAASLGVFEWSPGSNRLTGDGHLNAIFGSRALPIDESWDAFIGRVDSADRERVQSVLSATRAGSDAVCFEFCTASNHQPSHYMEAHAKSYGNPEGSSRVVGILQDVTQRHLDEERLRQSSAVFHTTADAIVITDARQQRVVAVNRAFLRITGYSEAEVIDQNPDELLGIPPGEERYGACLATGGPGFWHGEVLCRRKGGETFPAWQSVSAVRNSAGQLTHVVSAFSDVTAIYEAHRQLDYLAHHDPLTGLPNRALFDDRLEHAMEQALRRNERCLLLFLDLDGFKVINDTLGHAVGDELLRVVGARLRTVLRASDTVARLGGDEFVVLVDGVSPEDAAQLAEKILVVLRDPIPVQDEFLAVTGSIGIAVFPDNGTDSQHLMRAADMAMYTAKFEGRNRYHFYAEDMSARAQERMQIEQGLRRAIAADGLALHYQPRVDLADGRIVGVEALVRWPHPERGMVSPGSFIPIAEESGIIESLGRWVLRRACTEMLTLCCRDGAEDGLRLAVNVSARQFLALDFVAHVAGTLAETGFPAHLLELEITESTLQATERSLSIIEALERLGVAVSIDDFGTGYSSLAVLRDLPIQRIKIDRSFIVELPGNDSQRAVVEAIVALSRAMGMSITVEGIERREQAEILESLGCQEGQGFLFAHPMPFDQLVHRLQAVQPHWRELPSV